MAFYDINQGTVLSVPLDIDYQDGAWVLSGGVATHTNINAGSIRIDTFKTEIGKTYSLTFTVSGLSGGSLRYIFGDSDPEDIFTDGTYTRIVSSGNEGHLVFWSDANVVLSDVVITDIDNTNKCYIFNSDVVRFGGSRTYYPEMMTSFLDTFFSFRNGQLWKHNSNPNRNSFYGEVHESSITFVFNPTPSVIKNLKSIRLLGNVPWEVSEVKIRPRKGKHQGQLSRISKNRFESLQGQWFADFLKDMNDPRFTNRLQALFEGADLQGEVVEITIKITSENEVRLSALDVVYNDNLFSY